MEGGKRTFEEVRHERPVELLPREPRLDVLARDRDRDRPERLAHARADPLARSSKERVEPERVRGPGVRARVVVPRLDPRRVGRADEVRCGRVCRAECCSARVGA